MHSGEKEKWEFDKDYSRNIVMSGKRQQKSITIMALCCLTIGAYFKVFNKYGGKVVKNEKNT